MPCCVGKAKMGACCRIKGSKSPKRGDHGGKEASPTTSNKGAKGPALASQNLERPCPCPSTAGLQLNQSHTLAALLPVKTPLSLTLAFCRYNYNSFPFLSIWRRESKPRSPPLFF
jgi:hypothetical protein